MGPLMDGVLGRVESRRGDGTHGGGAVASLTLAFESAALSTLEPASAYITFKLNLIFL